MQCRDQCVVHDWRPKVSRSPSRHEFRRRLDKPRWQNLRRRGTFPTIRGIHAVPKSLLQFQPSSSSSTDYDMILGTSFREPPNLPNILPSLTHDYSPERVSAHQLRRLCRRQHQHDRRAIRTATIHDQPRLRARRLPQRPTQPDRCCTHFPCTSRPRRHRRRVQHVVFGV
jgi:hypothetical protein